MGSSRSDFYDQVRQYEAEMEQRRRIDAARAKARARRNQPEREEVPAVDDRTSTERALDRADEADHDQD